MLGVLPGIIGSIQALEAIKVLLDLGDPLIGRLLSYDALEESFRTFTVRKDPDVPRVRRARRHARARRLRRAVHAAPARVTGALRRGPGRHGLPVAAPRRRWTPRYAALDERAPRPRAHRSAASST